MIVLKRKVLVENFPFLNFKNGAKTINNRLKNGAKHREYIKKRGKTIFE